MTHAAATFSLGWTLNTDHSSGVGRGAGGSTSPTLAAADRSHRAPFTRSLTSRYSADRRLMARLMAPTPRSSPAFPAETSSGGGEGSGVLVRTSFPSSRRNRGFSALGYFA